MPFRIAFDLDGVLADMDGELVRHAEALFGEARPAAFRSAPPATSRRAAGEIEGETRRRRAHAADRGGARQRAAAPAS